MRERTRVVGYIVVSDGSPLWQDKNGILWRAGGRLAATIFPTRDMAQRRLERTNAYSRSKGLQWHEWKSRIVRVDGVAEIRTDTEATR